jgi:multidrug efflux system membrane fusion protein
VDVGNIIRASDATGIVTLTQVKPVAAVFSLPQQHLRAVVAGQGRGRLKVQAMEADNATVIQTGEVEVIDNQVDITTGTVRVKAIFANADLGLWPGQFINVRLFVDVLRQALVAPAGAIQRGPKGAFVYVLTPETKAAMKPVTVGRQDEAIAVIQSGVEAGETVITTGFGQLTDGSVVRPQTPVQPEASAPAEARPRGGPGQGRRGEGQGRRFSGESARSPLELGLIAPRPVTFGATP